MGMSPGSGAAGGPSRVALVTGGSRGIGRACALALAAAGHRVALCYRADKEGAAETAAAITDAGGEALAVAADVADAAAVDGAVMEIESAWGPVQILVNNAGVTRDGLLLRMSDEQWGEVLRTNLDGAFYAIRRVAPGMVRSRYGRIVNVGSASGATGSAGQVNYAAAKAGLLGLTRSVARELASRNVTCNLVAPGPISTAMLDALPEDRRADLAAMVPLARLGTPDEVGATVAFLCSEAAGYITGAAIPVDGGLSMGH
jgi:3-oxoacyl-[acyl-carrier protein] reductase